MLNTSRLLAICLILLGTLLTPTMAAAAPGDLDLTFSQDGKIFDYFGFGGRDIIYATAQQPDGKIVGAGEFSFGLGTTLCAVARYGIDGALDPTFDGDGISHTLNGRTINCRAIAVQADGKILVAGSRIVGNNYNFAVIRFNSNGSLDSSFGIGGMVTTQLSIADDEANAIAIQTDGKIVAAGVANTPGRQVALVRYMPDGSLDASFDTDGKVFGPAQFWAGANAVAIQSDGKIVTGGQLEVVGVLPPTLGFMRFNGNGSLDNTFSGDGIVNTPVGILPDVYDIAIQTDGKIIAAGQSTVITGTGNPTPANMEFAVVRLNTDGSYDTTFSDDGMAVLTVSPFHDNARSVAIQSDGKIVAAGWSYNQNSIPHTALVRLNADGSLDSSFNSSGLRVAPLSVSANRAHDVLLQPDGRIVIGGYGTYCCSNRGEDFALARFNTDGSTDNSFGTGGIQRHEVGFVSPTGRAVAVQPNGKVVVAGGDANFALLRYNADGTNDTTFDQDGKVETPVLPGDDQAKAIALQPDGKIVVAGSAGEVSGPPHQSTAAVARYNVDGSLDETFDGDGIFTITPGRTAVFRSVAIQSDGKIVLGGQRSLLAGGAELLLVRLLPNGTPDSSFDTDGIATIPTETLASGIASGIAIQPDGKIVGAGRCSNGTNTDFVVVRFNSNGTPDSSFDNDGIATTHVLSSEGASSIALQPDGKIVAAGTAWVNPSNEQTQRFAVVRYNTDGSLDSTFDTDGKVTTSVLGGIDIANAVSVLPNGKILVAGSANPTLNPNYWDDNFALVRYNADGSLDTTFSGDGKATIDLWGISDDHMHGMVLDSRGRAVVVGEANSHLAVARVLGDFVPGAGAPFDFDGDGKTDIGIYRPTVGEWWYQRSSDGHVPAFGFGVSTDIIVPADYTGDGKTDASFFRPSTGQWFVLRSEDNSFFALPFGATGDIPVPADFDADGKADPAVFRPSNATWYIARSTGGTTITTFGADGDQPVVADYDGDGKADIAIYRPSVGQWWLNRSTAGVIAMSFGSTTDKVVQGDYTGDGKADVAFWKPATGEWFVLRSEDFSFFSAPFGTNTDIAAPGDYDGDGKYDFTVFRPSSATWFSQRTTAGTLIQQFGVTGDTPIANAYVR